MKRFLQNWWNKIDNILYFQFIFSYNYIGICLKIFDLGFDFSFYLPIILYKFRQIDFINYNSKVKNNKRYLHQLSLSDSCHTGIEIHIPKPIGHYGLTFEIALLGLFYMFNYFDMREWDYATNSYKEVKEI